MNRFDIDWPQALVICVAIIALAFAAIFVPDDALRRILEAVGALAVVVAGTRSKVLTPKE